MILNKTSGLTYLPKRIISLVPSQTELLFDLGLETETVGITKFCVHPADWFASKQKVGGTKTVDIATVKQLQPDLIIANKEENVKEQVEQLAADYPVWVSDINNMQEALQMIKDIGALTGTSSHAISIVKQIQSSFATLILHDKLVNCAYLIWRKPFMAAGGNTFINDMLLQCGFNNIFSDKERYPAINISELRTTNYELLFLSSEPYPFKQKHIDELAAQLPGVQIMLVDGELFSWYGSRMIKAPAYFQKIINSIAK